MKREIFVILCSLFIGFFFLSSVPANPQSESTITKQFRAISLNLLQRELQHCQEQHSCPDELLNFAGITEIMGYLFDETQQEFILFGSVNPDLPPLHVEDFVVALRNAWWKYAPREKNVYQYSYPGCSIDPAPEVIQALQAIGQQSEGISSKPNWKKASQLWRQVCQKPQAVRVLGVPFHSHFAHVMVQADYDMKTIVNGSAALDIPGFASLTVMIMTVLRNQTDSTPLSLNRFWFSPGNLKYSKDNGVVRVKTCPVILLTEEEFLTQQQEIAGTGTADPLAEQFASGFSRHYAEIARQKPIYAELEGLFRFVALAKLLKYSQNDASEHIDYFLEQFQISEVSVPSTLPGIPHIEDLELQQDSQLLSLWIPSCGGVRIHIDVTPTHFISAKNEELTATTILQSRPSKQALQWDISDNSKGLSSKPDISQHSPQEPGFPPQDSGAAHSKRPPQETVSTSSPEPVRITIEHEYAEEIRKMAIEMIRSSKKTNSEEAKAASVQIVPKDKQRSEIILENLSEQSQIVLAISDMVQSLQFSKDSFSLALSEVDETIFAAVPQKGKFEYRKIERHQLLSFWQRLLEIIGVKNAQTAFDLINAHPQKFGKLMKMDFPESETINIFYRGHIALNYSRIFPNNTVFTIASEDTSRAKTNIAHALSHNTIVPQTTRIFSAIPENQEEYEVLAHELPGGWNVWKNVQQGFMATAANLVEVGFAHDRVAIANILHALATQDTVIIVGHSDGNNIFFVEQGQQTVLTADEILKAKAQIQKNRPTVILLSCRTGGRSMTGSFAQVFLEAGAARVIAPLENIDAVKSIKFLHNFLYSVSRLQQTITEALREAQTKINQNQINPTLFDDNVRYHEKQGDQHYG